MRYARPYIPNVVFYIPFGYYFAVRVGTIPKMLSWALIYLMPTAFYSAVGHSGSWGLFALNYLLILIATFSLYEYGYIFNDTIAIRHEQEPALRLYDYNLTYFERHHATIILCRITYAVAALTILYCINGLPALSVAGSIALMVIIFAIYNRWRNRYNVWWYPLLVCSRYLPFMLIELHTWYLYMLLFVSFPLLNAIERFSMPRYRWPIMSKFIPNEASKTRFRAAYYAIILVILMPLLLIYKLSLFLLAPILILFIYRLGLVFWIRTHQPINYLNG